MLKMPNYEGYPFSCAVSLIFIETLEMCSSCSALKKKKLFATVMLFAIN